MEPEKQVTQTFPLPTGLSTSLFQPCALNSNSTAELPVLGKPRKSPNFKISRKYHPDESNPSNTYNTLKIYFLDNKLIARDIEIHNATIQSISTTSI